MPYYRQEGRRGSFPNTRQPYGPPKLSRQRFGPPRQNAFSQMRDSFNPAAYPNDPRQGQQQFTPYQQGPFTGQGQQQFDPYQQYSNPGLGGLPDSLNTMMGHLGTITNGINMMRQFGSIFSLFR